jgi:oxygen-independent coproporphyrinogen-3 oxidase
MGTSEKTTDGGICIPEIVEQPYGLYPAPDGFSSDYGAADYCEWVEQSNGDPLPAPLVLYVQDQTSGSPSPSNKGRVGPDTARAIELELRLQGALFDADRPLSQLICTNEVATRWSEDQLYRLVSVVQSSFFITQDKLPDWCACTAGAVPPIQRLRLLRVLGFNQIRFAPPVTSDVKSTSVELRTAMQQTRDLGFDKVVVDWRGLPLAGTAWAQALDNLLAEAHPDRVRVSSPDPDELEGFEQHMAALGYRHLGLEWYLRESDGWWKARADGRLYWTLLGYSELKSPDTIGVGPAAMSAVCDFYGINEASLQSYISSLDEGVLPIVRGTVLEDSDVLRREIIAMILTCFCIRIPDIENKWGIEFGRYFGCETQLLRAFEKNGWLAWRGDRIEIKPRGGRELAEICSVFDGRADNPLSLLPHPASGKPPGQPRKHTG